MSREKENKILNIAADIAKNLVDQKYKIAAIITDKRNKILSIGWNSYSKSHPKQLRWAKKSHNSNRIFLHAEMSAMIRCKEGIPYHIYVARVNRKGKTRLAKPCDMCSRAIRDVGIKKIVYTTSNAGGLK